MLQWLNMPVKETVPQNTVLKALYFILSCGIQSAVDWTIMVLQLCEGFTQPALVTAEGDVSVEVSTLQTTKA